MFEVITNAQTGEVTTRPFTTEEISANQPTITKLGNNARSTRDKLLLESDWTQVLDAPVDQGKWAVYRQELRDISKQSGFPTNVVWPVEP